MKQVILATLIAFSMSACTLIVNSENVTVERQSEIYDPIVSLPELPIE